MNASKHVQALVLPERQAACVRSLHSSAVPADMSCLPHALDAGLAGSSGSTMVLRTRVLLVRVIASQKQEVHAVCSHVTETASHHHQTVV